MPSYFVEQIESNSPNSRSCEKFLLGKFSFFDSQKNRTFTFIILCICSFFSNLIITGSSTVVLSTLEKEFFLTSFESGLFLALFELGGFVSSPFFGFFGSLKNFKKLHLITLSLFFLLLGSYLIGFLIFFKQPALNNFFNTTYESTNLCSLPEYVTDSVLSAGIEEKFGFSDYLNTNLGREKNKNDINYKLLLYVGHFLIGLGSVAIYTVGIAYVEEIAMENKSPLWQGILYGTGSIGGGIGFLISGQFLNVNSRFFSTTIHIEENSINWIGAWWLPYLVYGTICGILAVLVFLFGFYSFNINTTEHDRTEHVEQSFIVSLQKFFKNFLKNLIETIKNIQLLLIIFSMVTEGVILKGFLGFMPKYIEYQFEMKASDATLALGLVALISVIAGTLLSANIIEKYKFEAKECSSMSLVIFFITSFCFLILFNYCPEVKFINEFEQFECNQCDCVNQFEPVCIKTIFNHSTNVFQSACHAGCATPGADNQFENCQCLMNNLSLNETVSTLNCLKGLKCWKSLVINGIAAFLIVFFTAMSIIPHLKSLLGCVDQNNQSVALGIKNSIAVILGNFGGTLLVGKSVDLTCKYWQYNCYGQKFCKLYDNFLMSLALAFIGFGCRILSAIFMIYPTVKFYKTALKSKNIYELTNMETKF